MKCVTGWSDVDHGLWGEPRYTTPDTASTSIHSASSNTRGRIQFASGNGARSMRSLLRSSGYHRLQLDGFLHGSSRKTCSRSNRTGMQHIAYDGRTMSSTALDCTLAGKRKTNRSHPEQVMARQWDPIVDLESTVPLLPSWSAHRLHHHGHHGRRSTVLQLVEVHAGRHDRY